MFTDAEELFIKSIGGNKAVIAKLKGFAPGNNWYSYFLGQYYDVKNDKGKAIYWYNRALSSDNVQTMCASGMAIANEYLFPLSDSRGNISLAYKLLLFGINNCPIKEAKDQDKELPSYHRRLRLIADRYLTTGYAAERSHDYQNAYIWYRKTIDINNKIVSDALPNEARTHSGNIANIELANMEIRGFESQQYCIAIPDLTKYRKSPGSAGVTVDV